MQKTIYIINYKPLLKLKNHIVKKKIKNNSNLIYCKNFFLFFLLIERVVGKQEQSKKNLVKLSIKKKKKYYKSFLRAPNKYKKAQVQIELVRYELILKNIIYYRLPTKVIQHICKKKIIYFIFYFFESILFFESTLFFLKKKQISVIFLKENQKIYNNLLFKI